MKVRSFREQDEVSIQKLFTSIFGVERSSEEWRWRFLDPPSGEVRVFLAEDDKGLAGHIAHIGFPTFIDRSIAMVSLGSDMMVRPDVRGQRIPRELLAKVVQSTPPFEVRTGFPTDQTVRLLERNELNIRVGRLTGWVRWHKPGAMSSDRSVRRSLPAIGALSFLLAVISSIARLGAGRSRISEVQEFPADLDELAARSASFARCIRVRDARYMTYRWIDDPAATWKIHEARAPSGELLGVMVHGVDQRRDPDAWRVVDLLARSASSTRALLVSAADAGRAAGCRRTAFDYSDPRPWSARACYLAGYVPRGRRLNFVAHPQSPEREAMVTSMSSWYLTLGDSDLA